MCGKCQPLGWALCSTHTLQKTMKFRNANDQYYNNVALKYDISFIVFDVDG